MESRDAGRRHRSHDRHQLRAHARRGRMDTLIRRRRPAVNYENILVEQRGAVTLITLNRPKALNALNAVVLKELIDAFAAFDADDTQRCAVLTGSEKAFAAGADITEMWDQGFASMYASNFFPRWGKVTGTRHPWNA